MIDLTLEQVLLYLGPDEQKQGCGDRERALAGSRLLGMHPPDFQWHQWSSFSGR
jgi:hypothetical protein